MTTQKKKTYFDHEIYELTPSTLLLKHPAIKLQVTSIELFKDFDSKTYFISS